MCVNVGVGARIHLVVLSLRGAWFGMDLEIASLLHRVPVAVRCVCGALLECTVDVQEGVVHDLGHSASDTIHGEGISHLEVPHKLGSLGSISSRSGTLSGDLRVLHIVIHVVGAIAGDDTITFSVRMSKFS